jgi:hypothetical protein
MVRKNDVSAVPRMSAAAAPRIPRERTPHAAPGGHLPTHGPKIVTSGRARRGKGGGARSGAGAAHGAARRGMCVGRARARAG